MSKCIETSIDIAFFGTNAIGIAIAKDTSRLLLLVLLLLRDLSELLLLIAIFTIGQLWTRDKIFLKPKYLLISNQKLFVLDIRSQCSENMQGSRRRGTSSSSSDADSGSPSVYTITDNCPYPSTSTRTNQSMFNEDVTVATLKT